MDITPTLNYLRWRGSLCSLCFVLTFFAGTAAVAEFEVINNLLAGLYPLILGQLKQPASRPGLEPTFNPMATEKPVTVVLWRNNNNI